MNTPLKNPNLVLVEPVLAPAGAAALPAARRSTLGFSDSMQSLMTAAPMWLGDVAAVFGALLAAYAVLGSVLEQHYADSLLGQLPALFAILCIIFPFFDLYPGTGVNGVVELRQLSFATTLTYAMLGMANAAFGELNDFEQWLFPAAWMLAVVLVPISRGVLRQLLARTDWWGQRALIIGGGSTARQVFDDLSRRPTLGLRPVGIIDDPHVHWSGDDDDSAYLGPPEEAAAIAERERASWAIVVSQDRPGEEIMAMIDRFAFNIPNVIVLPSASRMPMLWNTTCDCGGAMGIRLREQLLLPLPCLVKRAVDLFVVAVIGTLLVPFLGVFAALVYGASPGPVFYGHERIGRGGKKFKAWKFRTMVTNADAVLEKCLAADPALRAEWERDHKLKNDPRVIRGIGGFLRKWSLDELPQLWNVLVGDMSLVGPRPIVAAEVARYRECFSLYLKVRPGITGMWQVNGRNNTTYEERVRLDEFYVRNWSPWLDVSILVRTVKVVLLREGAY